MTQWFTTNVVPSGEYFEIVERPHRELPADETAGYVADNKRTVWQRARSQSLPVRVAMLNGDIHRFDTVFDPPTFERAAYSGYVSHGISMTDGVYYPIKFEQWVELFRKDALAGHDVFARDNDAPAYVKNSLSTYVEMLRQRVS